LRSCGDARMAAASAMRAFEIAAHAIMLGKTQSTLVVGVENMSMSPHLIPKSRAGFRMGSAMFEDAMLLDALVCSIENYHMGVTAENVAEKYGITREDQDRLAVLGQQRACAAIRQGKFKEEIIPVAIKQKKETLLFDTDEHPREGTTMEALAKLRTVFKENGTVTAGNASGVNDGAAAAVLMSAEKAQELGVTPLARVVATTSIGVAPAVMGLGPAAAIPEVLRQAKLSFKDIGCWEIHEAFAAQFLGVQRMLKKENNLEFDMEKVNRNGSGIALGHPVGCTGLRIIVTLLHEMKKTGAALGGATLCAGGGPAMAVIIEAL
ncbi:MAG: thiolase family protein, partial [Pseudomonadota bacterium]